MKVGIACDHRGFKLKEKLKTYLTKQGYEILDLGTNSNEMVDYSDYGIKLGEAVRDGISIACNKVKGIRCAKVANKKEAKETRIHNNANVVALSSRMFLFEAKDIIDAFLKTPYKEEERFERRIKKISKYEGK